MKKIFFLNGLLFLVLFVCSSAQAWWKEVPYKGDLSLKHGMMSVNSKQDVRALVTKKNNAKIKLWDLFLAKWNGTKTVWERQFFAGKIDGHSNVTLSTSRDGAAFVKIPRRQKQDLLVRIVDGEKIVVRNFMDDEVTDPSLASKTVSLIDMAAVNKNQLWCLLREVSGDRPRRTQDGGYVAAGRAKIRTFVEKWDGEKFKQMGKDIPSTGLVSGISAGDDGSVYLFVNNIFNAQDKLFKWNGSAWERIAIPLRAGDRITSLSVINANNMWLLLDNGNLYQWHDNTLDPRGEKSKFQKLYAAWDVVFVQQDEKMFQWKKGQEPVGFFERIKQFFSES